MLTGIILVYYLKVMQLSLHKGAGLFNKFPEDVWINAKRDRMTALHCAKPQVTISIQNSCILWPGG